MPLPIQLQRRIKNVLVVLPLRLLLRRGLLRGNDAITARPVSFVQRVRLVLHSDALPEQAARLTRCSAIQLPAGFGSFLLRFELVLQRYVTNDLNNSWRFGLGELIMPTNARLFHIKRK